MLARLRAGNPTKEILDVHDRKFREYGEILSLDAGELLDHACRIFHAEEGATGYEASNDQLEGFGVVREISRHVFGEIPVEAGCCFGYNTLLNGMEYHKSSEVIGAATDLVLMLGQLQDVDPEQGWDSALTEYVYLPKGTIAELYSTTLHLAPCRVDEKQFTAVIILPAGTNTPLDGGPDGKLWMKNKWMLAHAEGPAAKKGAHIGVYGENCRLEIC